MIQTTLPEGWTQVTVADEGLYESFFAQNTDMFSYENNWAFISQETRNGAIKYHRNGLLLTGVVRHEQSKFRFIFPPLGILGGSEAQLCSILHDLANNSDKRIVFRKLPQHLSDALVRTHKFTSVPANAFTHTRDLPEDIYPQVILNVRDTSRCESAHFVKIRNHLRHFSQHRPKTVDLTADRIKDVVTLIEAWTEEYKRRGRYLFGDVSKPLAVDSSAYSIFAHRFADRIDGYNYFSKIVYVDNRAVAFTLAGRTSPRSAALYGSISLTAYRGAAEHLIMQLIEDLATKDVDSLNMGGSETKGLFDFKNKFCTKELRYCYDAEYIA
jgi:hypothetical protein